MKTHILEVIQKIANELRDFSVRTLTRKYSYRAGLLIMKGWNLSRVKPFFNLFCLFAVLISSTEAIAQTAKWRYVITAINGSKTYLNDEIKVFANRNKGVWEKLITTDGSPVIVFAEWDCANKLRIPRQGLFYKSDGSVINVIKSPPSRAEFTPDSVVVAFYSRICLPAQSIKWAQIVSPRTALRLKPASDSPITRIAERGERFQITPESGLGGWFNIVDPKTQQDYWLSKDWFDTIEVDQSLKKRSAAPVPAVVKKKPQKTNPRRKKS